MTCREIREALDALLDGELEAGEELEVREHLDWCRSCGRELEELREWHGALSEALSTEVAQPTTLERRRTADAVIAALRPRRIPLARAAAMLAIGLSLGIVTGAVALSRPPREQVARVAERLGEQRRRDAELRAVSAEIEEDLGEALKVLAGRDAEDPVARAVAVGSFNIARRLGADPNPAPPLPDPRKPAAPRISITRSVDGATVSVTQGDDGRIRVSAGGTEVEARSMAELQAAHPELCRRYAIGGSDGSLSVGDSAAGADWKGRLNLLLRTGAWDEQAQGEAWRAWASAKLPDPKEFESRLKTYQERCKSAAGRKFAPAPVDVDAILRDVKGLTRAELRRTQERLEAEMKKLEARLQEAGELRERARGLRIFAEDAGRD